MSAEPVEMVRCHKALRPPEVAAFVQARVSLPPPAPEHPSLTPLPSARCHCACGDPPAPQAPARRLAVLSNTHFNIDFEITFCWMSLRMRGPSSSFSRRRAALLSSANACTSAARF